MLYMLQCEEHGPFHVGSYIWFLIGEIDLLPAATYEHHSSVVPSPPEGWVWTPPFATFPA